MSQILRASGRAMEDSEVSSSTTWRFSMELLSHVHTLRVFLFHSSAPGNPNQDCVSLEATLLCAPPALSCTWKSAHQSCLSALRLPLPLLLFDYSATPLISTLPNCIQLSLPLLPLPPFQLHAFSSLSLAHDGIHTDNPDGIRVRNSGDNPAVQRGACDANNGFHGDDGSSCSSDVDKNRACNDTCETGHAATCTSTVRGCCHHDSASEVGHDPGHTAYSRPDDVGYNDDAHQNHEHHDTIHAIVGPGSPADNGTQELRHVTTPAFNNCGCHHDSVQEEDEAGDNIHLVNVAHATDNFCSHEQPIHGLYHKEELEAHAAMTSHFPGFHNGGMSSKVPTHSFVHVNDNGVCARDAAFKSHEYNDTTEVSCVANAALDMSGCHHLYVASEVDQDAIEAGEDTHRVCLPAAHAHDNLRSHELSSHRSSACCQHRKDGGKAHKHLPHFDDFLFSLDGDGAPEVSLQCQHSQNAVDIPNNGSTVNMPTCQHPSQNHDSMVLDSSTHQGPEDQISGGAISFHCKKCLVKVSKNPVRNLVQLPCFDWRDIVENWFGACCCSFGSEAEILSASFEKSLTLRPGKCLVGSSTYYVYFPDVTVETESMVLNSDNKTRQFSTLHFLALGNGFMVWENQHSKYSSWLPVYCTGCTLLIGAYAFTSAGSRLIREGLHLFRCQITAFNANGTLDEMLRYATFKELLAKELWSKTEENTSHRFLIRSLGSQLPLLQLVVLDYESLICTGDVTVHMLDLGENPQITNGTTGCVGEAGLQRSIKVLFLDCNGLSANEIRSTDCWVQDFDAETIFMLDEFVDILKRELLSNRLFYPAACGLSEGFHGSFIHMPQK